MCAGAPSVAFAVKTVLSAPWPSKATSCCAPSEAPSAQTRVAMPVESGIEKADETVAPQYRTANDGVGHATGMPPGSVTLTDTGNGSGAFDGPLWLFPFCTTRWAAKK